jgi:class 3 adenylate cyclase/predicted ATPase
LGLERYEAAFRDNEINWAVLPKLTADDLKDIGVTAVGHRRMLLEAIAQLSATDASPDPIPPTAPSGGSPLPHPSPHAGDGRATVEAERRQLTIMFCDLVGSTPLSTRFDPEDLREIVGAYHRCVTDTVGRFGGFVAKYMGDGVLIYFGYPEAHEDDAERAARAGLAVIDAVGRLATQEPLKVRIGIATGLVVVGDLIGAGAAQERGVVGETPNLAARLQALARPGTLVVADSTRRQIGTLFEIEDLGPQPLAGFGEPQRAWRVVGESGIVSRFEALRSGTTPLVGRDEELALLLRRWQQAKSGEGRVVLVSGEPGIGKSRLTAALSTHIETEPHTRIRYFCSPHDQDSALYPFIGQLERAAGFARDDTATMKLDKLEALLGNGAEPGDLSLIAEMLSLSGGERFPPLDLSAQRKKERTLAALLRQLQVLAQRQPVLMIFEDLHWIDPTSRELLDLTVERTATLPVLLLVTYRPEFQPPWVGQSQVTVIALNRLGRNEGAKLVHGLAGNVGALPPEIVDEIVERTDGVPLFVEELTKAVVEAGADRGHLSISAVPPSSLAVPASLHASLLGRLDRLGLAAKTVAQVGAAIGRDFSYELLSASVQIAEPELQEALRRLVEAGLVFQRGAPPTAEYLFKHALVQDAAYATLLRSRRQQLHTRIGSVLEKQFPDVGVARPELLAHHFTEAGLVDRATEYWLKAGRHGLARSAMKEAEALLRKGLGLVRNMADGISRQERELGFQICLGQALFATQGWGAPGVSDAYDRARKLCRQLDQPQKLLPILYGQWINHAMHGEMDRALQLASEIRQLGGDRADRLAGLMGRWSGGFTSLHLGDFADARVHFEDGIALFDPVQRRQYLELTPIDALVFLSTQLSLAQACLGFLDRARSGRDLGTAEARRLGHAHTLAAAQYFCLRTGWAGRLDPTILLQEAEELLALSAEHGFPHWSAQAVGFRGWCLAALGEPAQGIPLLTAGLGRQRALESTLYIPHGLTMLADAYRIGGAPEVGLAKISEAERLAEATQVKWVLAETLRLRGDLLVQTGDRTAAEASYREALALAQEQSAKLWELHAATSLARLWREQGRRSEARDLLAPVYGWFTEGFDTADLKEAKALLDELG